MKPLVIELHEGLPTQPMTCSRVQGTLQQVQQEVERICEAFLGHGFPVVRVKVEAAPWNAITPQTSRDLKTEDQNRYFEHHCKVLIPETGDLEILQQVCQGHGAHLSRNAFKTLKEGGQERFVTLRMYGVALDQAQEQADLLRIHLEQAGFSCQKSIMEYCVLDTQIELDAGWGA
ncbi:hypothetical protein [Deinococcus cellulosilyticus]|uniref:Uncharacterized protein n=1 Tax=Deinococcus cellulosilyticus (strain DSM 18568 / NBRC 106333 / KACC 11606 / 5516J-15) TaxID=1223518 RepID=A0A511N2Z6_DEIC1|nr:hypothetical protein [Deinococcus cellulosilyticus]GEM46796.1 hypothetical protein DC3_24310 [Deinococcus cellulosilyticus NBRC 106333 = KACC 11606]